MAKNKILQDSGFWLLLFFNLYSIKLYFNNPASINSLYFIFWLQSTVIGIFNFIGILAFTNRVKKSFTVNNSKENKPVYAAFFFLVHYGIFHFVYLIFILADVADLKHVSFVQLKFIFWALIVTYTIQFINDKKRNKTQPVDIGTMFFFPYLRIIPMHIAILIPKFTQLEAPLVFLFFKIVADIMMYIIYQRLMFKPQPTNA
jgi:hypothetical protein